MKQQPINMLVFTNPLVGKDSSYVGYKNYELSNHLGNVLTTVRDIVNGDAANGYWADVSSIADYSPFGVPMPHRTNDLGTYRYAYNGMETDNEVCGIGNSYTTEFRQYDPRLGRWKSLDPLMHMFPSLSPYCAFDNNPIYFTDPSGLASEGEPDVQTRSGSSKGDRENREEYLKNKGQVGDGDVVVFKYPDDKNKTEHSYTYDQKNNKWDDKYSYNTSTQDKYNIPAGGTDIVWVSEENKGGPQIAKAEPPSPDLKNGGITGETTTQDQTGKEVVTSNDPVKINTPVIRPPRRDLLPISALPAVLVRNPCFQVNQRPVNMRAQFNADQSVLENPNQVKGMLQGLSRTMINSPLSTIDITYNMRMPEGSTWYTQNGKMKVPNWTIGVNRANAIKDILMELGVPEGRINVVRGNVTTGQNVTGTFNNPVWIPCP
jgi:RHS repeat-associated protein